MKENNNYESLVNIGRVIFVIALVFTAIFIFDSIAKKQNIDTSTPEMSNFNTIDESKHLAYDIDTLVVYYVFSASENMQDRGYGYSYFAPYISKNGKFCRYINGEIVEITDNVKANE